MKNTKLVLIFTFLILLLFDKSNAQDKRHPWVIGIGINAVDDFSHDTPKIKNLAKDYVGINDWNTIPMLSKVNLGRYIGAGFSANFAASVNIIRKDINGKVDEETYAALDLGTRYDLNNLVGETKWFDPYVKLSIGSFWVNNDVTAVLSPGLGFNTWFNESVGLNFESSLKSNDPFNHDNTVYFDQYHVQHSISFVIRFAAKDSDDDGVLDGDDLCPETPGSVNLLGCPDNDGDGIPNQNDECPNLAGPISTNGCPDTDRDGISNKNDACPNIAGGAEFNGCPDTDKDGVADNEDKCPDLPGKKEDKGCPDTDGDGLANHKDRCPGAVGPIENKGCPWADTDGDGITDNLDKCINQRGPKRNNGCPVKLTNEAKKKLGTYAKTIQFNSGKSEFKPGVTKKLDKIATVMTTFDGVIFDIEGHSDSQGNNEKNLILSKSRAQAVVDYLKSHGIASWRLKAVGYGETKPIASNKTASGRALNRRVVLTAK